MRTTTNSTNAAALAVPQSPYENACRYISSAATLVASPGPPLVITMISAKDCRPVRNWVTVTNSRDGRSSGRVIFQKTVTGPAPSSAAAS